MSPAQPSPDQPSVGLAKALPKPFILQDSDVPCSAPRQLRFWSVFGLLATVPLRLAVLEGPFLVRSWRAKVPPSRAKRHAKPSPAQPSPAQPSPAQPRPAQPSPSPAQALVWALSKASFYRIQTSRFRPPDGSVFGLFLARLGPPCRCVWLFWRVNFWFVPGAPKCRPADPSATREPCCLARALPNPTAQPAQPS